MIDSSQEKSEVAGGMAEQGALYTILWRNSYLVITTRRTGPIFGVRAPDISIFRYFAPSRRRNGLLQ